MNTQTDLEQRFRERFAQAATPEEWSPATAEAVREAEELLGEQVQRVL